MKKYLVGVLVICMAFILTGCGCTRIKKETVIGKWTTNKVLNAPATFTFNKDNTVEFENSKYKGNGTYKIEGNKITITGVWYTEEEYEYEIKDDELSLKAPEDSDSMSYLNMKKVK